MVPLNAVTLRRLTRAFLLVPLLVGVPLSGCESSDDKTVDGPVCGLVDAKLAAKVVGSTEFDTNGTGAVPRSERETDVASCSIRSADPNSPTLQVRIGEVTDPEAWRTRLADETTSPSCSIKLTGDPGYGYACHYETGLYVSGTGVNVVRGDRVIRVVAYKWPGASADQRLAVAEEVVRNADKNLTAYDKAQG